MKAEVSLRALRKTHKKKKKKKSMNHAKLGSSSDTEEDQEDVVVTKTEIDAKTEIDEKTVPKSAKKIYVRYAYIPYISQICTTSQTFSLRIDYDLYWDTNEAERKQWKEKKESGNLEDYKPSFRPTLVLQNLIDPVLNEAQDQPEGSPWVVRTNKELFGEKMMNFVRYEVRGTFQQKMNTRNYPFDCQILHIHMCIKYQEISECILVPCTAFETNEPLKVFYLLQEFNSTQEWDVIKEQCEAEVNGHDNYPWLVCKLVVHRRPWGFIWKYMSVLSFLTWCAVAGFSLDGRADLMGFLITLQLTIVALQYAVSAELPPCPVPSFADWAMICGNVFTSALTVTSAVLPEDEDTGELKHGDVVVKISSVVLGVIHLFLFCWAIVAYRNSNPHNAVTKREESICSVVQDKNGYDKLKMA